MASSSNSKQQPIPNANERTQTPLIGESATDLNVTLSRHQWMNVVSGLSIAAGQAGLQRDFEQMFAYTGLCTFFGTRLGVSTQITGIGESPPGAKARAATA